MRIFIHDKKTGEVAEITGNLYWFEENCIEDLSDLSDRGQSLVVQAGNYAINSNPKDGNRHDEVLYGSKALKFGEIVDELERKERERREEERKRLEREHQERVTAKMKLDQLEQLVISKTALLTGIPELSIWRAIAKFRVVTPVSGIKISSSIADGELEKLAEALTSRFIEQSLRFFDK